MKYIIDSNCFVTPHRTFCPTDVGVSFWNKIRLLTEEEKICSLDKVRDELYSNSDDLKIWMTSNLSEDFFLPFDNNFSIQRLSIITQWAASNSFYTSKAKEKFLRMDKADIYLASFASVNPQEWTIVSMERSAPNSTGEIKLPDVCRQYHVKCIQIQEMFREIGDVY